MAPHICPYYDMFWASFLSYRFFHASRLSDAPPSSSHRSTVTRPSDILCSVARRSHLPQACPCSSICLWLPCHLSLCLHRQTCPWGLLLLCSSIAWSLISSIIPGLSLLLKYVSVLGSNGGFVLNSFIPMKYCRYGISVIISTSSMSDSPSFFFISSDMNDIRAGFAIWPVFLPLNDSAYLSSISAHGISVDNITHLLLGSRSTPTKCSGLSNNEHWLLYLYICKRSTMSA